MRVSMNENEENEKVQLRDHPQNTITLWEFLQTKMKKWKSSTKGPSTKYERFIGFSMDENEENEKVQ